MHSIEPQPLVVNLLLKFEFIKQDECGEMNQPPENEMYNAHSRDRIHQAMPQAMPQAMVVVTR